MTGPAQEIARWFGGDMAQVRPFCVEVQRMLACPEIPWLQIAAAVREHPNMPRSAAVVAAFLRGTQHEKPVAAALPAELGPAPSPSCRRPLLRRRIAANAGAWEGPPMGAVNTGLTEKAIQR